MVRTSSHLERYKERLEELNRKNRYLDKYSDISRKGQKQFRDYNRESEYAFKKAGANPQMIAQSEISKAGELLKFSGGLYTDLAGKDVERDTKFGEEKAGLQLKIDLAKEQEEEQDKQKENAMWGAGIQAAGVGLSLIPGVGTLAGALLQGGASAVSGIVTESPEQIISGAVDVAKGVASHSQLKQDIDISSYLGDVISQVLNISDEKKRGALLYQMKADQSLLPFENFQEKWDKILSQISKYNSTMM